MFFVCAFFFTSLHPSAEVISCPLLGVLLFFAGKYEKRQITAVRGEQEGFCEIPYVDDVNC